MMPLVIRCFYRYSDVVLAVSEGVADDLAQVSGLSRDAIQVVFNPVITSEILSKAKEPIDHPWFEPGNLPVVLGAGRLVEQKDFKTLIRAFEQVSRQHPARLVILGEGEERSRLMEIVRERGLEEVVDLPGFVDNPYAYMARSSVFVLSSAWEGLPNTLIQALAVGTPVVSTDCESGPREILQGGRFGSLVPVGDEKALASAVLDTLQKKITTGMGTETWEEFSADKVTETYLSILRGDYV